MTQQATQRAFERLQVGTLVLEAEVPSQRDDRLPYGGMKESGVGREGTASRASSTTASSMPTGSTIPAQDRRKAVRMPEWLPQRFGPNVIRQERNLQQEPGMTGC